MKNVDRRQWLKTVGLSGGFALLGGMESLALTYPPIRPVTDPLARLNANENPYGPSRRVRETMTRTFDEACRYPFRALSGLVKMIAEREGVSADHVVITGGSTEGLKAAGLLYGRHGGEIIAADPTFHTLMDYAESMGARIHRVPLNTDLEHDLGAMAARISAKTSLVFICNPNNPTGTLLRPADLRDFCTTYEKNALIFCDEAYYDFITEPDYPSMVELVLEGLNIVVSRTFSKVFGLAGLRIGYLIAPPELATALKGAVMANTNILAIAAASEALRDDDFYKYSLSRNAEAREKIYATLEDIGMTYVKSHTNFVFFRTGRPVQEVIDAIRRENVLIGRPFPPLTQWARVSTGTPEEIDRFCAALKKVMA